MRSRRTFEHYCRPWWCLSGCRRFHVTYRQMCHSRRERRSLRAMRADISASGPCLRLTRDEIDGGCIAERTDMPGVMGSGDTVAEALADLRRAIAAVSDLGLLAGNPEGNSE